MSLQATVLSLENLFVEDCFFTDIAGTIEVQETADTAVSRGNQLQETAHDLCSCV